MLVPHLAGLRTLRIKLDLLGGQLPPSIHIVTQVNSTKCSLAQELPTPPCHRSTGSWGEKTPPPPTTNHTLTYHLTYHGHMKNSNAVTKTFICTCILPGFVVSWAKEAYICTGVRKLMFILLSVSTKLFSICSFFLICQTII